MVSFELPRRDPHPFDVQQPFISRPPGVPEIRQGVRRFTLEVGGQDLPAIECFSEVPGIDGSDCGLG